MNLFGKFQIKGRSGDKKTKKSIIKKFLHKCIFPDRFYSKIISSQSVLLLIEDKKPFVFLCPQSSARLPSAARAAGAAADGDVSAHARAAAAR